MYMALDICLDTSTCTAVTQPDCSTGSTDMHRQYYSGASSCSLVFCYTWPCVECRVQKSRCKKMPIMISMARRQTKAHQNGRGWSEGPLLKGERDTAHFWQFSLSLHQRITKDEIPLDRHGYHRRQRTLKCSSALVPRICLARLLKQ